MEVIDSRNEKDLSILRINSSETSISFSQDIEENEDVTLKLSPVLFINLEEKIFATKISATFYNSLGDKAISSPIMIIVFFAAKDFESIFKITKEKVQITQMPIVLKMLDTAIGIIRGVLYEQTKDTTLSNFSLPFIVLKDFMTELKIRVIKKKDE